MPVMGGIDAIRIIREKQKEKKPRILVLTASTLEEKKETALQTGADNFIYKPYRENQLLQILAEMLNIEYDFKEKEEAVPVSGAGPKEVKIDPDILIPFLVPAKLGSRNDILQLLENNLLPGLLKDHIRELADNYLFDDIQSYILDLSRGRNNGSG